MQKVDFQRLVLPACLLGSVLFLFLATILPRATTEVFASPDETAVAAFARGWSLNEGFKLPTGIPESLQDIPGLHPRSMVQQGEWLVPVGFLGMPMLAAPFEWAWEGSSAFLTALLILSSAWPLFRLASRLGKTAAWTSVIVYLSFPTVLLYANRGLFPNLPVVALAIWSIWLLREEHRRNDVRREIIIGAISGVLIGFAITIRSPEALWIVPWMIWAAWGRVTRGRITALIVTLGFVCGIGYFASVQTYGSLTPTNGYWLKDVLPLQEAMINEIGLDPFAHAPTLKERIQEILPFGVHPRAAWKNIRIFLFGMMGLWVAAALMGVALKVRNIGREAWTMKWMIPAVLTGWTFCVLMLFYGQSLYADNINQAPSLGNSFLRYLLPMVPLIAIGIGMLAQAVWESGKRGRVFAMGITIFFAVYGILFANLEPQEGIMKTHDELQRYVRIRDITERLVEPGMVVLSERSDKIFVGLPLVVVSPLPEMASWPTIVQRGTPVVWFHRFLYELPDEGLSMMLVDENEALYRVPTTFSP